MSVSWDRPELTWWDAVQAFRVVRAKIGGDASISYKAAVRAGVALADYAACQIPDGLAAFASGDAAMADEQFAELCDSVLARFPEHSTARGSVNDYVEALPWALILRTILRLVTLWV